MYNLHTGVYGLLDIQIQYLDMPHYLSDDVGSIAFSQNGGDFSLSSHPAPPTGRRAAGKEYRHLGKRGRESDGDEPA